MAGYIEQRLETTKRAPRHRSFTRVKNLALFGERACCVITSRGLALAQQLAESSPAATAAAPAEGKPLALDGTPTTVSFGFFRIPWDSCLIYRNLHGNS